MKASQSHESEVLGEVEVIKVREPSLRITERNFQFELGKTYIGMTASTMRDVAPYEIDGIYRLTDGAVLYETADPRRQGSKWLFTLKKDGFYYMGGFSPSDFSIVTDPVYPSFLSLPLHVGKQFIRSVRHILISSDPERHGWRLREYFQKLNGEIIGQHNVKVGDEEHECLLLRDRIRSHVTKWYASKAENYDYSVLLDRYIREDGMLQLEHIWYCEEGGVKSISEEKARKEAKDLFKKTSYADKEWYRVHGHIMKKRHWRRYP